MCIDQLDNTVNKYNITCDSTIKIKSVDVKIIKYLDFCIENNDEDPKFKVGDDVRILILFYFFSKYAPNESEEVFVTKKVKSTVPWTYAVSDLNG